MITRLNPIHYCLMKAMSEISEDYYCAGWLIDLEYILWGMLQGGDRDFGLGTVDDSALEELKSLSDQCNGWIAWEEDKNNRLNSGEVFVPMERWLQMYDAWKKQDEN